MIKKQLSFIIIIAVLLFCGSGINWQGTGNMTSDNLTAVWTYIKANFSLSWSQGTLTAQDDPTLLNFAIGLSQNLNHLWDEAWNVVAVFLVDNINSDSVLYGYAFRDHWMWFNGHVLEDNSHASFIIWKDYNCFTWQTHSCNIYLSTYPYTTNYNETVGTAVKNAIISLYGSVDLKNIWQAAKSYSQQIPIYTEVKSNLGSDTAFTIILSESNDARYFGRFCAKGYMANYKKVGTDDGSDWGEALVIQMR